MRADPEMTPEQPWRDQTELFAEELTAWADVTFPNETVNTVIAHLRREVDELRDAATDDERAEEMADCFMMLVNLAHKLDRDIIAESWRKLGIVRTRSWSAPDSDGVVEHVRDAALSPPAAGGAAAGSGAGESTR